jgi:hypothetical protein
MLPGPFMFMWDICFMPALYHTATLFTGRWVAKFVALAGFATAGLWVRIQTSLKNTKMGDLSNEGWPTLQNKTPAATSPVEPDNGQFGLFEDDQP